MYGTLKRILRKKDHLIVLFSYKTEAGRNIFCFLRSDRLRYLKLASQLKLGKRVKIADYGDILDFGENTPSEQKIEAIKAIYA